MPLPRETMVDVLTRQISARIIDGTFPPGSRLDELTLAARFKVSRTPVREALGRLGATGLIERRAHRGVVVALFSQDRLDQMFEVLVELEGVCARLAARRMDADARDVLAVVHGQAGRAAGGDGAAALNLAFHQAIYRGARNAPLTDALRDVRTRLLPFRRAIALSEFDAAQVQDQHGAILAAIATQNGDLAAQAMRDHFASARPIYELPLARDAGHEGAVDHPVATDAAVSTTAPEV